MKKLFLIFATLFALIPLFGEENLTPTDLKSIYDFMNYRPVLTTNTPEENIILIQQYKETLSLEENKVQFSEQGYLVLETLLISEEFNYYYEIDEKHPALKDLVVPHNKKLEQWIKNHPKKEISAWLYVSAGDLLSCSMGLYSIPKAMEIGLEVKDYYTEALEKNPNMTYGNLNMAQWYFHAPAFGGGSKKKANELFLIALENAKGSGEEFYTNLIYSQFLFDQNNKEKAQMYFNKAAAIQPNSKKTEFLKLLNDNGYTLFYYTLNREKVEKKLGI
jgi:hypothetical protein